MGRVRTLALAAAGQVPGTAVAVVGLEAQRLGVAPMQVTESAADGGFTATASLERDGARVEGKAGYGGSKKTARQAAALSLLAVLTGLVVSADDPPAAPCDFPDDPGLSPADLESWLDYEVARPSPDPELATAVRPGKLTARSVYLLLFEADPRGWASARAAAWEALVSAPMMAGGVLSMSSQARGWPMARYIETGERSALAFLPAPDGLVVGVPSRAATAKAARAGAALALLRDLAPPAPSPGDAALIFTGYVLMGHLIQAHLRTRGMPAGFLHGGVQAGNGRRSSTGSSPATAWRSSSRSARQGPG